MLNLTRGLILTVATTVLTASFAPAAQAELFVDDFSMVRAELEHRRDNDFSAPFGRSAKRQRKAVEKSIALLDKPADDLLDDLATAVRIERLMARAYRDEFREFAGKEANMAGLLDALASRLSDRVDDRANLLHMRAEEFEGKVQEQVERDAARATDKVGIARELGSSKINRRLAQLKAAARAALRGEKQANRAAPNRNSVVMLADSGAWMGRDAAAEYFTQDQTLMLRAQDIDIEGNPSTLTLIVRGVAGRGVLTLDDDNSVVEYLVQRAGQPDALFHLARGSVRVLEFDLATPRIELRFAVSVVDDESPVGAFQHEFTAGHVLIREAIAVANATSSQ